MADDRVRLIEERERAIAKLSTVREREALLEEQLTTTRARAADLDAQVEALTEQIDMLPEDAPSEPAPEA